MRHKHIALPIAALGLAVTACTSSPAAQPAATTGAPTEQQVAPTTTAQPATTAPPTTTTLPPVDAATLAPAADGLGDSLYPWLGNGGYDVEHYTVDLSYTPEPAALAGQATIDALATEDLVGFNLDFTGFEISAVTIDDVAAEYSRAGGELAVVPTTPIPAGEGFVVVVSYSGQPAPIQSAAGSLPLGWLSAVDGTQFVVAEPDAGNSWFPANDHPLDKATFTFRITVPDPLLAVANGVHVDTITDLGVATWVYEMDQPMATYLATVVIGDLEVVPDDASTTAAGVPIRNVLPADIAADPPAALAEQGEMLAFLDSVFGPYPFELYGIAVVPDWPAALENQTLSIFGTPLVQSPIFEFVLVHELAHQWFGDHVSVGDWGDIWLNEGFATYAEWLWLESTEGPEALDAITQGTRERFVGAGFPPPGDPPAAELFNASVYQWGGLTLHALRLEIGDDAFFATLRTYVDRFGGTTARTEDFIAVAEEESGLQLDDLFDAWLHGDDVPKL